MRMVKVMLVRSDSYCLLLLLLVLLFAPTCGMTEEPIICAALSKYPYTINDRDSGPGGLCSEVVEKSLVSADIPVIMQDGTYEDSLAALDKGTVDCVPYLDGSLFYQDKYELAALNLVLLEGNIITLNDGGGFDPADFEGKKIGFIRGDLAAHSYLEQLRKGIGTFNVLWFDSYMAVQTGIINGELEYAAVSKYLAGQERDEALLLKSPLEPIRITLGFRKDLPEALRKMVISAVMNFQVNNPVEYYKIIERYPIDKGCFYRAVPVDTAKFMGVIFVLGGGILFILLFILYRVVARYLNYGFFSLLHNTDKYYKTFINIGVPVLLHKTVADGKNYVIFSNPAADRFFSEGYKNFNFDNLFYSELRGKSITEFIQAIPPGCKRVFNLWKKDQADRYRYEAITNVMPYGGEAMTVVDCKKQEDDLLLNLQESQYALEMATEVGRIGVFEFDMNNMVLIGTNQCFTNLGLDYLENGISFKDLLKLVKFENYRVALEEWRDLLAGRKKEFTAEIRVVTQSGEKHWMRVNAKDRNRGTKNAGKKLVGVIIDIDDVRSLNTQLEDFSRNFELLMEFSQDDIYAKDCNYKFLWCSRSFALKHGFSDKNELVGKDDFALHREDLADEFRRIEHKVIMAGGAITNCEQYYYNISGEKKWVLCTKVPIRDNNGVIRGLIGINKDITDYKNVLHSFYESQRIQSVGKLAGGIAHEFNNALNGIMGFASILGKSHHLDSTEKKFVKYILQGTDRCERLTRHLLAFAGKGKYVEKVIDIHKLIQDTVRIMKHSLQKSIEFKFELNAEKSWMRVDVSQLENVVINLVSNADDAIGDTGTICFETSNVELPQELQNNNLQGLASELAIEIRVSDDGVGIDPDNIGRIFEPFFTTKSIGDGVGLGLAAAYGIIANHKGSIKVQSELGKGSCFIIMLPVLEDTEPVGRGLV